MVFLSGGIPGAAVFVSVFFSIAQSAFITSNHCVYAPREKSGAARESGGRPGGRGACVALTAPRVSLEQGRRRRWCR